MGLSILNVLLTFRFKWNLGHVIFLGILFANPASACETINIPMCQAMQYNMTRMPNLLHHSTQLNAMLAIEQYQILVDQNCSDVLLFFLCAMYVPICTMEFQLDAIPPCKGVCEKARQGCEPLMLRHNTSWPSHLSCDGLPYYDKGVCIMPTAIVSALPGDSQTRRRDRKDRTRQKGGRKRRGCSCQNKVKLSRHTYMKNNYDFAIKARPISTKRVGRNISFTKVEVRGVLKCSSVRVLPHSVVTLWSNSTCRCPRLKAGKEYLLMGYEDRTHGRLVFPQTAVATPWKKKWLPRILAWDARTRRQRLNGTWLPSKKRNRKQKSKSRQQNSNSRRGQRTQRRNNRRNSRKNRSRRKNRKLSLVDTL